MGKASRRKRLRDEAVASTSSTPLTSPPPRDAPPWGRLVVTAAALAVLIGTVAAFGPAGEMTHGGLLQLGLLLAVCSASIATAHAWAERYLARLIPWSATAAPITGLLSLMALMGRHPEVHLSVFTNLHSHFVGVPSEVAFVALAAGALAVQRHVAGRAAWWMLSASGLWCLAVLGMPHHWLGDLSLPLSRSVEALGDDPVGTTASTTVLLLLIPMGAWATSMVMALRTRVRGMSWTPCPARLCWLSSSGVALLALHHLLTPLWRDGTGALEIGTGLVLAGLMLLVSWTSVAPLTRFELATSHGRIRWLDVGVPGGLIALYLALKIHGMGPSNTDENIYFYMADALSRGEWPYRDYFFAHPPLHVLAPGAVMALTGFGFGLVKSFSVLAGGVTGLVVWAIGREHLGRLPAATAMVAFLFAAETLKATTNMTGINLTTMWLMLGIWQGLRGRGGTAGVLFGIAACTGFYSMGAICAALALGAFHSRRFALRQLAGFLLVAGAINAAFFSMAGEAYLDGVYRYHGLKSTRETGMVSLFGDETNPLSALWQNLGVMVDAKPFRRDTYYHAHLWLGGLVAPLVGAAAWWLSPLSRPNPLRFFDPRRLWREGEHGVIAMVWLFALALFVQYAMFRELYSFYFVLIYPTLALCLAGALWQAVRMVTTATGPGFEVGSRGARALAGIIGLALLCSWPAWSAHANKAFPSEQKGVGTRHDYTWRPAPVAEPLSEVAHTLYWEDFRLRGNLERGYRHYLWTKKRRFSKAEEIASWIAERSSADETIAGASGTTPLIALLADRRLAAGEADTNSKRFKAGRLLQQRGEGPEPPSTTRLIDDATYWNAICADNVRFLVSTSRSYFTEKKLARMPTVQRWFRKAKVFWDEELKYGRRFPITIYERSGEPLSDGRVCRWE